MITMLKKGEYFIPRSQLVGDIFSDEDEVACHVEFRSHKKNDQTKGKKEKKAEKANEKVVAKQVSKSEPKHADKIKKASE